MAATEQDTTASDPAGVAAARAGLPPPALLALVVAAFAPRADPARARILDALARGPLRVRDLALVAGVSVSATSHQLRLLRDRRLVTARRAGNVISCAVASGHVAALFREAEYHADHVRQGLPDHSYPLP